jgi:hypothetical protein
MVGDCVEMISGGFTVTVADAVAELLSESVTWTQ